MDSCDTQCRMEHDEDSKNKNDRTDKTEEM